MLNIHLTSKAAPFLSLYNVESTFRSICILQMPNECFVKSTLLYTFYQRAKLCRSIEQRFVFRQTNICISSSKDLYFHQANYLSIKQRFVFHQQIVFHWKQDTLSINHRCSPPPLPRINEMGQETSL